MEAGIVDMEVSLIDGRGYVQRVGNGGGTRPFTNYESMKWFVRNDAMFGVDNNS